MQTLDLSGESKKSDGRIKSLLWPTVDNAWDVDYLGQQGFWICLIIALLSAALLLVIAFEIATPEARNRVLLLAGLTFFVYVVGGMGVRETSWPAALSVFVLYAVNQLGSGRPPGVIPIIIGGVLLSNVRATFLASRWKPPAEGEDRPMRFNETLRDKLVDQLPPRLWPILRIPFFIASIVMLVFILYFAAIRPAVPAVSDDDNVTPSTTLTVDPPSDSH
ncbi:hypothetical protein [Occallatibacter savannae]|uniref:hypothetical protein n=1 Tax=Occallatibacter savannae TaxID=1002691 RepID=UPI0013A54D1D|nr:hypothetical protein [Occallatibacter savannae]